jgi:hypothetical protein
VRPFRSHILTLSYPHTIAVVLLLTIPACSRGPDAPQRGTLEGSVTINGKPVASGLIRFMAIDPSGTNVVATITDGQYSVPEGQGPSKGKYRIEFSVPSATKRRIPNDDIPGEFIEEAPETLPARYHSKSEITADYDPAQPRRYDFQLTTP